MKKLLSKVMAVGVLAIGGGVLATPAAHANANGAYIQNRYTGLCLATHYNSKDLFMQACDASLPTQRWDVMEPPDGGGAWYIKNANTGWCIQGNGSGGLYMSSCTTNFGQTIDNWTLESTPYAYTHYLSDRTTFPYYDCMYNVGSTLSTNLGCANRNTDEMWYIS